MTQFNILIVDDNIEIHSDFRKIFSSKSESVLQAEKLENVIFSKPIINESSSTYNLIFATQGQESVNIVKNMLINKEPISVAFIDIQMPPGWDGIETIAKLWEIDPAIQMIICTAYSDYSWDEIKSKFENADQLLILKKPFDNIEALQLAAALTKKWLLHRETQAYIHHMDELVQDKTRRLEEELVKITQLNSTVENALSMTNSVLEATGSGILVLDLNKMILKTNQTFLSMFSIHQLKLNSFTDFITHLSTIERGCIEPKTLLSDFDTCYNLKCPHELHLKDGRVIEVHSQPKMIDNQIDGVVYTFTNITTRREMEQKIIYQETHDVNIGISNRALLTERLELQILECKRKKTNIAVIFINLDNFRLINECLSHTIGDLTLKEFCKRIGRVIPNSDLMARVGGDEFVILIPDLHNPQAALIYVSRIYEALRECYNFSSHEFGLTASTGISFYPTDGDAPELLINNADTAMYSAKEQGKNKYVLYSSDISVQASRLNGFEHELNAALAENELVLMFQPIVSAKDYTVALVEVLLRWEHSKLGRLSPEKFIGVAERNGAIYAIGEWVIRSAFKQLAFFHTSGYPDLKIAINLSSYQLMDERILLILQHVQEDYHLPPANIEFEITESVLLVSSDKTKHVMQRIIDMGYSLTLDDFGTGFCSLAYLRDFPIRKLKMDKSFISNLENNNKNFEIVSSMLSMAHSLNLQVVAEGVQTIEEIHCLREKGCDLLQGYYFSEPLNDEELYVYLAKHTQSKPK